MYPWKYIPYRQWAYHSSFFQTSFPAICVNNI